MNNKNKYLQPSINIKEMLYYIVKHWRSILIVMILCGLMMAGVSYQKNSNAVKAQQNTEKEEKQMTVDEFINDMDIDEASRLHIKDAMEILDSHQASYNQMAYYLKNSVLMNLDASEVPTCTLAYYVDNKQIVEYPHISETNNTTAIVQALLSSLYTDELQTEVNEIIGKEAVDYITEIIDTTFTTGNNGSFTINIYYKDEESVKQISEVVQKQMIQEQKELQKSFGEFDLTLGTSSYFVGANANLLDQQRMLANNMANVLDAMTKAKNALDDDEKEAYDKVIAFEKTKQTKEKDTNETTVVPTISKKWLAVGLVLGVVLVAGVYFCAFLWGNKLKTEDEFLQENLNVLGVVRLKSQKRRWLAFVDRLVDRTFGKQTTADVDKKLELLAVRIAALTDAEHRVVLAGCRFSEQEAEIAERLRVLLEDRDIQMVTASDMMGDAQAMTLVCEAEMVVFMEEINRSDIHQIREQIEMMRQANQKVGGVIVIA